ncbi:MAG TPA: hypothetical protein VFR14_07370, partial [Candidatus Limnocylindrales bacterium]|nr:hypothetical protein [Candidatus Limnocylindrales bacterium]
MDPVRNAPGIIGWFPVLAILLALTAVVLIPTIRRRIEDDEADAGLNLLPFALLLVAAILATASAVVDTVVDARAGLRELTTAALAVMCATPVTGAIVTRWRWGSPGSRTFHQQIAANRVGSVVLTVVLVEVLALTGYVIGASIGAPFGAAMATGVVLAAVSVVLAGLAAVVAARRGPDLVLDLVHARPLDA